MPPPPLPQTPDQFDTVIVTYSEPDDVLPTVVGSISLVDTKKNYYRFINLNKPIHEDKYIIRDNSYELRKNSTKSEFRGVPSSDTTVALPYGVTLVNVESS